MVALTCNAAVVVLDLDIQLAVVLALAERAVHRTLVLTMLYRCSMHTTACDCQTNSCRHKLPKTGLVEALKTAQ